MDIGGLLEGAGIGIAGGLSSGLFGVSPGGALVVFSVLFLGAEQHVAQGISLVAQIPPTGLAGVSRYRQRGFASPKRWLAFLVVGYLAGGVLGAFAASRFGAEALRWVYVAYLAVLLALLLLRREKEETPSVEKAISSPHSASLLAVGIVAGASSGFLGIGGGLVTTVGLRVRQHQAQLVSLALSLIPTTAISAWVYWREGWIAPWPLLLAVVIGLLIGTDLGARVATRVNGERLKTALACLVAAMTAYMTYAALYR